MNTKQMQPVMLSKNTIPVVTNEFGSRLSAVLNGVDHRHTAIDALVDDLRRLAGANCEQFFAALQDKVRGRTRNHIAREKLSVYPDRPDLGLNNCLMVAPGWWLGTNISNREKLRILEAACRLKGLRPVSAPDTSADRWYGKGF